MSDQEREQKKLRFLSSIDQNFKQSEKDRANVERKIDQNFCGNKGT